MNGTGLRSRSRGPVGRLPRMPDGPRRPSGLRAGRPGGRGPRDSGRSRLVAGLLVVAAIVLLVLGYQGGSSAVRSAISTVTDPVQHAAGSVYSSVSHSLSSLSSAGRDRRRVEQLTAENADLRRQLAGMSDAKRIQADLSKLDLVATRGGYRMVAARVVAAGEEAGLARTVTINAGSRQGLKPGLLVVAGDGLAGTTVQVRSDTSVVRLVTDVDSHIGARLEGSQALGKVDGQGGSRLLFTLYDASIRIRPGQRLVTFGSLDYAAGVPVGTVTKVVSVPSDNGATGLTRQAEIAPFAPLGSLDLVGVIVAKPASNPGDRVLPAGPSR